MFDNKCILVTISHVDIYNNKAIAMIYAISDEITAKQGDYKICYM